MYEVINLNLAEAEIIINFVSLFFYSVNTNN